MATYAAIKKQIADLEKQADSVRKAEVAEVIAKMKDHIKTYGLTAKDLGLSASKGVKGQRRGPLKISNVPKYRDPKSGRTWTGHGKPPLWIAGKRNRDAFLIDAGSASTTASSPAAPKAKPVKKAAKAAAKPAAKAAPKKTAAKPAAKKPAPKKAVAKKASKKPAAAPAAAAAAETAKG